MHRKPPACPDCSSKDARPFVVPQADEQRRYRADLRATVLTTSAKSERYPAWECPDCGQCFGDAKKPQGRLPVRTQAEWSVLISTVLPAPVTSNEAGDLLGGNPAAVIVRVTADKIVIMEAGWDWADSHHAVQKGRPFAEAPLRTPPPRIVQLINMAWGKRVSQYRWCPRCQRIHEPEFMHGAICGGCAERVLGVVH
jgi:hypothetical protein